MMLTTEGVATIQMLNQLGDHGHHIGKNFEGETNIFWRLTQILPPGSPRLLC